jgi:hypothetical protein
MASSYTSSNSAGLVDPSYFLIPDGLKFRGQHTLFKSWENALTPTLLPPSGECCRLVIIGTIVVIVPFFTLLLFKARALLMLVFYPATCISTVDDVMQISVIPVLSSVMFLRWKETACRVPMWTLLVVNLMTPCFVITVECWVNHSYCIQHHLEVLHVC